MATYELNRIGSELEAQATALSRIEEKLDVILAALNTAEIVDITNELQAQKAAANTDKPETTGTSPETGDETTRETSGNTETVGATRIGGGE